MKFHPTVVEKLLQIADLYSGRSDNKQLKAALMDLQLEVYDRQDGQRVAVLMEDYVKAKKSK